MLAQTSPSFESGFRNCINRIFNPSNLSTLVFHSNPHFASLSRKLLLRLYFHTQPFTNIDMSPNNGNMHLQTPNTGEQIFMFDAMNPQGVPPPCTQDMASVNAYGNVTVGGNGAFGMPPQAYGHQSYRPQNFDPTPEFAQPQPQQHNYFYPPSRAQPPPQQHSYSNPPPGPHFEPPFNDAVQIMGPPTMLNGILGYWVKHPAVPNYTVMLTVDNGQVQAFGEVSPPSAQTTTSRPMQHQVVVGPPYQEAVVPGTSDWHSQAPALEQQETGFGGQFESMNSQMDAYLNITPRDQAQRMNNGMLQKRRGRPPGSKTRRMGPVREAVVRRSHTPKDFTPVKRVGKERMQAYYRGRTYKDIAAEEPDINWNTYFPPIEGLGGSPSSSQGSETEAQAQERRDRELRELWEGIKQNPLL